MSVPTGEPAYFPSTASGLQDRISSSRESISRSAKGAYYPHAPATSSTQREVVPIKLETRNEVLDAASNCRTTASNDPAPVPNPITPLRPLLGFEQVAEAEHRAAKDRSRRRGGSRRVPASRRLEQSEAVRALQARIQILECSEQRMKVRLLEGKENLKDTKVELQAALHQASILEERLDEKEAARQKVARDLKCYRGWWLNEFYSLKVVLELVASPDDGILALQESSRARYTTHLASLDSNSA